MKTYDITRTCNTTFRVRAESVEAAYDFIDEHFDELEDNAMFNEHWDDEVVEEQELANEEWIEHFGMTKAEVDAKCAELKGEQDIFDRFWSEVQS